MVVEEVEDLDWRPVGELPRAWSRGAEPMLFSLPVLPVGYYQRPPRTHGRLGQVRVTIAGHAVEASFGQTGTKRSPHTDHSLDTGRIEFRVSDHGVQGEIAQWLQSRRPVDVETRHFSVVSNSYSSVGFSGPWMHTVEVEEYEDLKPTEFLIDGLRVRPERFEERSDDGGLTIATIFSVDAATRRDLERVLKAHSDVSYFPVRRVGVEDRDRTMRFGRSEWSEHGAVTKYHLFLVEKAADDARTGRIPDFYPDLPNIRRQVGDTRYLVEELLTALVEAGVLSSERRREIENRMADDRWERWWSLFKVEDVEQTWVGER